MRLTEKKIRTSLRNKSEAIADRDGSTSETALEIYLEYTEPARTPSPDWAMDLVEGMARKQAVFRF